MGPFMVALFFSAGVSAWLYTQLQRRMGGSNSRSVWMATGGAFLFILFISYFIFNLFL